MTGRFSFRSLLQKCRDEEHGAVMTEVIVIVPFLTFLAVGILEFGNIFWQRGQIETGLRDASRYVARCPHALVLCETTARNLAYYGSVVQTASLRVPNWAPGNSPITFVRATETTTAANTEEIVTASTSHQILHSPLFRLLAINQITIAASHNQRVIGR